MIPPQLIGKTPLAIQTATDDAEGFGTTAKNLLGLTPLAIGGFIGYKRMRSNAALPLVGNVTNSEFASVGRDVGRGLGRTGKVLRELRKRDSEKFISSLLERGDLENTLRKATDKRKELLASILPVLEQTPDISNIRQMVLDAIDRTEALSKEEITQIGESLTLALETGGPAMRETFEAATARYRGAGSQLTTPVEMPKGLSPEFVVTDDVSALAKTRFSEHRASLKGVVGAENLQLGYIKEPGIGGGKSYYARLRHGGEDALLSLDVVRMGKGEKSTFGAPVYRTGSKSYAQTYLGSQLYSEGPTLSAMQRKGETLSSKEIVEGVERRAKGFPHITLEDAQLRMIKKIVRERGKVGREEIHYINKYTRFLGQQLSLAGRPGMTSNRAMNEYLINQAIINSSRGMVLGMETLSSDVQNTLIPTLSMNRGGPFDIGGSAEIRRFEEVGFSTEAVGHYSLIGDYQSGNPVIRGNAPLNLVRDIGNLNRVLVPATARYQQAVGKSERLVASNAGGFNEVGSTLGSGRAVQMFGQNLEFASTMVEGMNVAFLMDVKGGAKRLGLSEGMAYFGGDVLQEDIQSFTLIEPFGAGRPSTPLLNELNQRRKQGLGPLTKRGKEAIGDFFRKHRGPGGGAQIGELDTGLKEIPHYSDLASLSLELHETSEGMGRDRYHLTRTNIRNVKQAKLWSMFHKGTIHERRLNRHTLATLVARMDPEGKLNLKSSLKRMGIGPKQIMAVGPDTMKKASMSLAFGMINSIGFLSKGQSSFMERGGMEGLYGRAKAFVGREALPDTAEEAAHLGKVTRFVAGEIGALSGVLPEEAGLAFGAIFHMGGTGKEAGQFGLRRKAVTRTIIDELRKQGKSKAYISGVIKAASQGISLWPGMVTAGPAASTLGESLGSFEPRSFQFLHHRLSHTLGLSDKTTTDFLIGLLARGEGSVEQLGALTGITRSMESMAKGIPPGNVDKDFFSRLPKVGLAEFYGGATDPERTRQFLSKYKEGFLLQLTGDKVKGIFGKEEIHLPGKDVLEQFKGIDIVRGKETFTIEDEYTRGAAAFSENLQAVEQATGVSTGELRGAQEAARDFGRVTKGTFARLFRGVTKGKVLGSSWITGAGLILQDIPEANIMSTVTLSKSQKEAFGKVFQQEMGGSVFPTGQAFLDIMRTYRKGAEKELISSRMGIGDARRQARQETGRMFEAFFTGMEGRYDESLQKRITREAQGVSLLSSRAPALGSGHITPVRGFRFDFGHGDSIFESFVKTAQGNLAHRKLEKASGRAVRSFADIAALGEKDIVPKQRARFFQSMAREMSSYMGVGGGTVYFPDLFAEVHYTSGDKHLMNLSRAKMQFGDFDADIYNLIAISEGRRGAMTANADVMLRNKFEDLAHAAYTEKYFEEASEAIKTMNKSMGLELPHEETVFQSGLKEVQAKNIGPLNSALDTTRLGLLNSIKGEKQRKAADRAIAMLAVWQEVGNIKARRLIKAGDLVALAEGAFWEGVTSGGEDTRNLRMLAGKIFPKSTAGGRGAVESVQLLDTIPGLTDNPKLKNMLEQAIRSVGEDSWEDTQGALKRAFADAKENRREAVVSERRLAGMDTQDMRILLNNAETLQTALREGGVKGFNEEALGFLGRMGKQAEKMSGMVNKRMIGPLALGAVSSVLLGGLLGNEGYASTPLVAPGEFSDTKINAAIASGNLLSKDYGEGPMADQVRQDPRTNLMGRPINLQEAYFAKNNAWRISGEVPSTTGLGNLSGMISKMGGSSAIRINDTRRPITPDYIDRILGE